MIALWAVWWLGACQAEPTPVAAVAQSALGEQVADAEPAKAEPVIARTVGEAFPLPAGAERVSGGAFGDWLRALPVAPAEQPVRDVRGRVVSHRARVVPIPMTKGDLQQCADSLMRLRATWLRTQGVAPMFHATSGDPMPLERWAKGERPHDVGNRLAWRGGARATTLDEAFEPWLAQVMVWAGTISLAKNDTVPDTDGPTPGDVLVVGGSPGHAVILLDVARRGDATFVLIGEGFMPAQDFHVELGDHDGWWRWDDGVRLDHWAMPASALRAWPAP